MDDICKYSSTHKLFFISNNLDTSTAFSFITASCLERFVKLIAGLGDTAELLQAYLGMAWAVGCAVFGLLVRQNSAECRIARQYLTQAAVFVCALATMALTAVEGSYRGYVMFVWVYGKPHLPAPTLST